MNHAKWSYRLLAVTLILMPATAFAVDVVWVGTGDGNTWTDANNWRVVGNDSTFPSCLNKAVPTEAVGQVVDAVSVGSAHWSATSGDPQPDLHNGLKDMDNSFGEHDGKLEKSTGHQAERFNLFPGNRLTMTLTAPKPGQYVIALQGMTGKNNSHVLEYRRGEQWVKVPVLSGDPNWPKGWQVKIFRYLIETAPGQTKIPIRLYSTKQRLALHGMVLAKPMGDPFSGKAGPAGPHPRLLFSKDEIPALRKKLTEDPFCSKMYPKVRNIGYAKTILDKGGFDKVQESKVMRFRKYLLIGSISSAVMDDQANRKLALELIEKAMTWKSWGNPLRQAGMIRTMSIAYDCLYEHLGADLQDRMRRRIENETRNLYMQAVTGAWWASKNRANNWQAVCNSGIGMGGLALAGEADMADELLAWGKDQCKIYLRTTLAADGSCREAYSSYFNYGVGSALSFLFMLNNATGENLLGYDNDVLARTVDFSLYLMHPQRDGFCQFDDTNFGYQMNGVTIMAGLAKYKQDPLAQWMVRNYAGPESGRDKLPGWRSWEQIYLLLWYDPNLATIDPEQSDRTPLARAYDEPGEPGLQRWSSGHVVMRTGFSSKDDICLMTQCGDSGGYHGHADQGSFVLDAYGGHLVGDVGKYGGYGGIGNNWAHGPDSHSIVTIDGKSQVSNHQALDGRKERDGTIDAFVHSRFVDYTLANSKPAYDAGKNPVTRAKRHFLFVRKSQRRGYFVLIDDLAKPDDDEHVYSWRLQGTHFHRAVLDETAAAFSFVPSDDNYWNRGGAYAEGKGASLQVLFATPGEPKMNVVASQKVRGWLKGKASPPEGTDTFFPPYVTVEQTAKRGLFAALLYPESKRLGVKMPPVERINDEGRVGFRVGEDLILFRTAGGTIKANGVETDAQMLLITGEGKGREFFVTGATYLISGGKERFRASAPISIALDAENKGAADGPKEGYTIQLDSGKKLKLAGRAKIE